MEGERRKVTALIGSEGKVEFFA